MKTKYSKKLIWDYINGEDIPNIDDLESDYKFMLEVLKVTNDKNMYNLCSDEMKNNYEFIKSVVEIFIDDKKFIKKVANEYLQKADPEDIKYQELIFFICDLTDSVSKSIDDELIKYHLKRNAIYLREKANIDWNLSQEDYKTRQEIGMGFAYLIYEVYSNSEIILRYFAKRYIDEIFYNNNDLTLEELVHKHFYSYEKLQEIGIKKYILNYISYQDKYLAEYLVNRLDLIQKLEQSIINIGINWNNYNKRHAELQRLKFEEETEKLIEKYNASFNFLEACYYADCMNLHLPVKLCECEYFVEYIEELKKYKNEKIINIADKKCLKEIIKLAKEIFVLSEQAGKIESNPFTLTPIVKREISKDTIISLRKKRSQKY